VKKLRVRNEGDDRKVLYLKSGKIVTLGPRENKGLAGKAQPVQEFDGELAKEIFEHDTMNAWAKAGQLEMIPIG